VARGHTSMKHAVKGMRIRSPGYMVLDVNGPPAGGIRAWVDPAGNGGVVATGWLWALTAWVDPAGNGVVVAAPVAIP